MGIARVLAHLESPVVILGMGATGLSCARFLQSINVTYTIIDTREQPPMLSTWQSLNDIAHSDNKNTCLLGSLHEDVLCEAKTLLVSPGISLKIPAIQHALNNGASLISDIDLLCLLDDADKVAVTGTNGKSTVVTLLGDMAKTDNKRVVVAGNIGYPVLDVWLDQQKNNTHVDLYVLELSSFQLERCEHLSVRGACVLNVSEDHMDRYDTLEEYRDTKLSIYKKADHVVINRDDHLTMPVDKSFDNSFGSDPVNKGLGIKHIDGQLWLADDESPLASVESLKIKGMHNAMNALACIALGKAVGLSQSAMVSTLQQFSGLAHRCEFVARVNDVDYLNDSKATNEGATVAALDGLSSLPSDNSSLDDNTIVLIAGGDAKGADFAVLTQKIASSVKAVVLLGAAKHQLEKLFSAWVPTVLVDTMQQAVSAAAELASTGDIVLLSPACASLDMYKNYEARGNDFSQCVRLLKQGAA